MWHPLMDINGQKGKLTSPCLLVFVQCGTCFYEFLFLENIQRLTNGILGDMYLYCSFKKIVV